MRITILAIGRLRDKPAQALFDEYVKRIAWPVAVREFELRKAVPAGDAKEEEAKLLLAALDRDAILVALDERGAEWSSAQLAAKIGHWRDDGVPEIAFAIGGADGHGAELVRKAAASVAFGRMTWPHRLARVMLAEQIYRAQQILAGHPYHRA